MKTRDEMTDEILNYLLDNFDMRDLADLFINGLKGLDEMSDEDIKNEYNFYFNGD
jgi:hypothetical protein